MSFPLSFLLIPYGFFLLFFALMSLVYLYHLLRYGAGSWGTYLFIAFFVVTAFIIASVSLAYISAIDWSQPLQLIPTSSRIL